MQNNELLKLLAITFDYHNISYIVIGNQAVLVYGNPKHVNDIVMIVDLTTDEISEIEIIIKELDLEILVDNYKEFVNDTYDLPCSSEKFKMRVDFIFSSSEYDKMTFARSNIIEVDEYGIKFASLEDIIIHKMVSGKPGDFEDVKSILSKNKDFQDDYVSRWLNRYDSSLYMDLSLKFKDLIKEIK